MKIKINYLRNAGIVTVLILIGVLLFIAISSNTNPKKNNSGESVTTEGDVQIITISAKGGYSPKTVSASADKETILRFSTQNSFDCSTAVTIPELGYNSNLPPTGTTEVKIPKAKATGSLTGVCTMGMYSFRINFN